MSVMSFVLDPGDGGWVRWETAEPNMWGLVRVEDADGRLEICDLYMKTTPAQRNLSRIPLARIENLINGEAVSTVIRKHINSPGPLLEVAASFYRTRRFGDRRDGPDWVAMMQAAGRGQSTWVDPAWSGSKGDFETSQLPEPSLDLDIPQAGPYPDDFYERFAKVYEGAAWRWPNPAVHIMDANGIENASTIHRWVRVARERGYLPPAGRD